MTQQPSDASVEAFIDAARSYCSLIEAADTFPRGQLVWRLGERLTQLYAAGSELPQTEPASVEGLDDRGDGDGHFALSQRLREKLGGLDGYRRIFDPYDANDGAFVGSLSDDLADIYRDVKEGLAALADDANQADVVWEWRHSFGSHWGIHAGAALYAIHWITHTAGEEWISPDDP